MISQGSLGNPGRTRARTRAAQGGGRVAPRHRRLRVLVAVLLDVVLEAGVAHEHLGAARELLEGGRLARSRSRKSQERPKVSQNRSLSVRNVLEVETSYPTPKGRASGLPRRTPRARAPGTRSARRARQGRAARSAAPGAPRGTSRARWSGRRGQAATTPRILTASSTTLPRYPALSSTLLLERPRKPTALQLQLPPPRRRRHAVGTD